MDRAAIQSEVDALEAEIFEFLILIWPDCNCDGSLSGGITFQVGPDSGQTLAHSIAEMAILRQLSVYRQQYRRNSCIMGAISRRLMQRFQEPSKENKLVL